MTVSLDPIQSLGLAVLIYVLGQSLKNKVKFFRTYFIPAPVIGGLLFSILNFILLKQFAFSFEIEGVLKNFFMNIFFTAVGFTCSFKIIKSSGKQGAVLAVVAVIFLIIQNLVGIGLSEVFHLNPLLGIAMGSISMSGGVGSGAAFGPMLEELGAAGGTTVGVAAATFGLMMGSLVGGPVAKKLIEKYNLSSQYKDEQDDTSKKDQTVPLIEANLFNSVIMIALAAALGTIISMLLNKTGIKFPYYVGCLFGGCILRNLSDQGKFELRMKEIDIIGHISLNLFLSLTLMSLNINKLIDLAVPMIVILLAQTVVMMMYAYFVTFRTMGKNYDAAVMAAGHCGVGLGQTPNAIANMSEIIKENGPAPTAWFVLPVITVVFINIFNPIIITTFINLFK